MEGAGEEFGTDGHGDEDDGGGQPQPHDERLAHEAVHVCGEDAQHDQVQVEGLDAAPGQGHQGEVHPHHQRELTPHRGGHEEHGDAHGQDVQRGTRAQSQQNLGRRPF